MNADWISAISAIAQVFIGIGTFVLSYVLYISANRKAKIDYIQLIQNDWNELNTLLLSFPELAKMSDEILANEELINQDDNERLKRYLKYKILNILESVFVAKRAGLIYDDYHRAINDNILTSILKNDELIDLVKKSGYNSKFVNYCEDIHKSLKKMKQTIKDN